MVTRMRPPFTHSLINVLSKLHAVTAQPVVCAVDQPGKPLAESLDGGAHFLGVNIR
jgi:hypothetical protein